MSEARRLLARYLVQRDTLGEGRVVLPADRRTPAEDSEGGGGDRERREAPASVGAARGAAGSDDAEAQWKRGAPTIPGPGIVVASPERDLFKADPLADMDLDDVTATVRGCTQCTLCKSRKQAVPGEGPRDARLVVVGEGPGATEDETGRPFVGRAGELLTEILAAIQLPRERVFICNVVKCRPPSNRKPVQNEIDACVPYLYRQLEIISPKVILAMGGTAAETLLKTKQSLSALRNQVHEFRGLPLVVTYHPAALLRNPNWKKPTWDDVRIARQLLDQ